MDFQIWTKLNMEDRAGPGLACAHELVALCELIHPGLSVEGRLPGTKNVAQRVRMRMGERERESVVGTGRERDSAEERGAYL